MANHTYKATGRTISRLVWMMAAMGCLAGTITVVGACILFYQFELHRESIDNARRSTTQTIELLRNHRGRLAGAVLQRPAPTAATAEEEAVCRKGVHAAVKRAKAAVLTMAGGDIQQVHLVASHLDQLAMDIGSLQDTVRVVLTQAERCKEAVQLRDEAASRARSSLSDLLSVADKAEGTLRIDLAIQLNDLQRNASTTSSTDSEAVHELVQRSRSTYHTLQLRTNISEMAIIIEQLLSSSNVDELANIKDNRIRQTLARLHRDCLRLTGDTADLLSARLQDFQADLIGRDSIIDGQNQSIARASKGLYRCQLEILDAQTTHLDAVEHSNALSEDCLRSEQGVLSSVAELQASSAKRGVAILQSSYWALSLLSVATAVAFLVSVLRIQHHVTLAIRESEESYREATEMATVVAESPNEVYVFRQDTLQFIVVNDGACEATGYAREELLSKTPLDIKPCLGKDEYRKNLSLLASGHAPVFKYQTEQQKKSGECYPVEVAVSHAVFSNMPVYVAFVHDLTDVKRLEGQLAQAQKLESVGQLAAGIAHEINTPIQYVGDNTRFLKDSFRDLDELFDQVQSLVQLARAGSLDESALRDLESVVLEADVDFLRSEIPQAISQSLDGVEHIAKIVRAMKEFSHPGDEQKTPVDLKHAIETTVTVAKGEWKYVADVVTHFDPELPVVSCLPGEINQVLLNLIVNAAHAIGDSRKSADDPKGVITVTTQRDGMWVKFSVQDTGVGISDRVRQRMFDPFFTTKGVGKGTGQGLAIARSVVVDKHSGTIECESEIGVGTTFIIRIPINGLPVEDESHAAQV
jgi:PAS domain S-box-containing protein